MTDLLQIIVSGLLVGGIYAFMALGMVLIFKATGVFNFASGHLMALGAFVAILIIVQLGLPIWLGIIGALVIAAISGILAERLALRRLIGQPHMSALMATLALAYLTQGVILAAWQGKIYVLPEFLPTGPINLGAIVIDSELLWPFIIVVFLFGGFAIFFARTKIGLGMRATAEDHQLAQLKGINVKFVFALTWAIAGVLGTVAGILMGHRMGVSLTLAFVGFRVIPVVLLGGLDSINGAIVGGLIIGIVERLVAGYFDPWLTNIAPFIVLLIIMIIRPEGLFGQERIERV
ncbi:MAG: branched-chain amino acid ABC transporter permease [Chloroflexi bacterium]|nr:branched-chain amino acid ABC transporter permease [Chloroflexota bacterium]MBM3175329.1 branched-chain amino acid ABC transporter permease [Chloroflexota bacterium]MBM4449855.1 branched-chain amino acid ABC transporter permease [Chloroflexota bacterium]